MKKMNKKGFTLIEMLVVIAIIAVLVAIIIPIVTSSTDKAAAAANAANLRSLKAEIVTKYLSGDIDKDQIASYGDNGVTWKECKKATVSGGFVASIDDNDNITVTYGGLSISDWADLAGNSDAGGGDEGDDDDD